MKSSIKKEIIKKKPQQNKKEKWKPFEVKFTQRYSYRLSA